MRTALAIRIAKLRSGLLIGSLLVLRAQIVRPFVPLAFASQVRPGSRKRLLGQWREDMGAVCVDAAPVRFMGMAEHAASAEMLTASRYDKLDVLGLGSPAQAVHSSWQVRVAIASCRGDRKSVMHRTASASRSWKLVASMCSAGVLRATRGARAMARSWRCFAGCKLANAMRALAAKLESLPAHRRRL